MRRPGITVAVAACLTGACGSQAAAPPLQPIRIASANRAFGEHLAEVYNQRVAGVRARLEPPESSRFYLKSVDDAAADIAFVRADIAYSALSVGTPMYPRPHHLRGIAVVGWSVLHVVVRAGSPARSLTDLRGTRLGLAAASPVARQRMARDGSDGFYPELLAASGLLKATDFQKVPLSPDEVIDALAAGEIDGALFLTPSPATFVRRMAGRMDLRLIEIDPDAALRIRAQHPFYKPALIPAGTYPNQHAAVATIGVDSILVCRENLDEALVYELVKALFESPSALALASDLAGAVDPDLAAATPIPLHPGAARYYRERELAHY